MKPASDPAFTPAPSTRRSLESFNWNASLRSVFDTICGSTGFVFVTFTLALGIPKESLGIVASIASFACLFQMIGLMSLERIRDKKRFAIRLAYLEPLLLIAAVLLLPFLPGAMRLPALCIALFAAAASVNLSRPITDDWLAATIPSGIRGRYLGKRMQISSFILILTLAGAGFIARGLAKDNPVPYSLLLILGALFGLLAARALRRAHLPDQPGAEIFSWSAFPEIFKNKLFLSCLGVSLVYNIPFWFAMPYYQVYYLRVLHMNEMAIAGMIGLSYICKILISPWIGRWLPRLGPRSIIFWVTVPYLYLFFSFLLCTPERTWPLWLGWVGAAAADAGFSLALTATMYESIPKKGPRKAYFVANNLFVFATAGVLTASAAALTGLLKDQSIVIGPWRLGQFQILYLLCTIALIPMGFGSAFFLPPHKKTDAPLAS